MFQLDSIPYGFLLCLLMLFCMSIYFLFHDCDD